MTAERKGKVSPMGLAWGLAVILALAAGLVFWTVPALRYTLVRLTAEEKAGGVKEKKKSQVKKPEPTEKQIREIADRVAKKKKEKIAKEIRELEKSLKELEEIQEEKVKALGLDEEDLFRALVDAAGQKAEEIEELSRAMNFDGSIPLKAEAVALEEAAVEMDAVKTSKDPGLVPAVEAVMERARTHATSLEAASSRLAVADEKNQTRIQQAKGKAAELESLLQRLGGTSRAEGLNAPAEGQGEEQAQVPAPTDAAMAANEPIPQDVLEAMEADELYAEAQRLEEAVRDAYATGRAAELAAIQETGLAQALADVATPPGSSPDLAGALAADKPGNRAEFQAFNAALDRAGQAVEAMGLAAKGMVGRSQEFGPAGEAEAGSASRAGQLRSALQQAAGKAAGQSMGAVVNLVPMMGAIYDFSGGGQESSAGEAGSQVLNFGGDGTQMKGVAPETAAGVRLQQAQIVAQLLPGRKFTRQSKRQGWLYLDTWYVIGPFQRPNEQGLNFSSAFPPETRVDLDARYPGKINRATGRPVELVWRFHQSNTLRITPPDEADGAVYYAYTEVHFDEPTEALIAVATDDAAKVWINDLVVWQDTGLSPWRLDEGFRRVLFRKGYNRVMVRIENGPVVCQYSILLCPLDLSTAGP